MVDDDPGWDFSWRNLPLLLVPGFAVRWQLKRGAERGSDALVMLRQIFLTFCVALVGIGVVVAILYSTAEHTEGSSPGIALGLLVVGAVAGVLPLLVERPLACDDETALAASYRTRFFLRMAFAEVAALFGFVGFFLSDEWWAYPIGAAITAIGFRRAAPTAAHLAGDQEQLATQGCGRSLVAALRQPLPPRA